MATATAGTTTAGPATAGTTTAASATADPASTGPGTSGAQRTTSPRLAAKIAGVSYVLLFALAIFANFFVREGLIDSSDAGVTATNIAESEGLFRLGLVSFLVIFALDVVVSWALYIVFRDRNRDLSLLAAWFRLVYTVFLGVAVIFFFQGLQLLSGAEFLTAFSGEQLHAQALVALELFNSTWFIGLATFGLHLLVLGWMIIRTDAAPRALGMVMMVAGAAYVIDTVAHSLLGNYSEYENLFLAMVSIPSIIGEGWFGLWLLLRAAKPGKLNAA